MDPQMEAAYQDFMLGGGGRGGKKKKKGGDVNSGHAAVATAAASPVAVVAVTKERKQPTKGNHVRSAIKAFEGRFQVWNDTDLQAHKVVQSIAHLRDRIYWESKHLTKLKEDVDGGGGGARSWQGYGYRSSSSSTSTSSSHHLVLEDVELALNHDVLQHERMMGALRSLVASLSQVLDAMGRRLDEWMIHELEEGGDYGGRQLSSSSLENAQEIYARLSLELYRKQKMVQAILNSCHNGMLQVSVLSLDHDPRKVANKASKEWQRKPQEK